MVSGEREAIRPERVRPRRIEEEMRTSYLDYAMSVIVSRALPDVRDGLKPVQRRILYAMDDLGLHPTTAFKKSARIVGEVLGKYHPHSDAPVYEAMVRMAQEFTLRYPLVAGQGNFGSIDADPPAAMRYTEARLSRLAEEMLTDIDKQTVAFTPNFDGSLNEPTVLPARLPNLLINGSSGIAVGMATTIPPHHLGEIGAAIKILLATPDASVDDLMTVVQGPDFPSGAMVFGGKERHQVREIYATGHGRLVMRAVDHVEDTPRGGRSQIVFTQLPYQVNKAALIERIADLVRERRLDEIADLRDESDRHGLRVVVELKRDAHIPTLRAQLFKLTSLQTSYTVNMVALLENHPRTISLKQALAAFIDHRRAIIRRRTEFDLEKARDRHHIVTGLLSAIGRISAVIEAIRKAESGDAAKRSLQRAPFRLSERQAQAVLDMQLRRLAALERSKLEEEERELRETIAFLEGLLADPKKIDGLIADDMDELTELYAGERRTPIIEQDAEHFSEEDLVAHQTTVVSYSRGGYIKRMPLATYRTQHRGGKGIKAMATRAADAVSRLLVADTHDHLLFFTDRGRVFNLKVHVVEERTREWRGLPIRNLIQLDGGETVTAIVTVAAFDRDYLLLATRRGQIKKTALQEFASVRRAGLVAFNLRSGDELVLATTARAGDDVLAASDMGLAVRFAVDALRQASRGSGGVRAIRLPEGASLMGLVTITPGVEILTVTSNGFGKRTGESQYPRKGRGGKGMAAHKITDRSGPVVAVHPVQGEEEIVLISAEGKAIRTTVASVAQVGRSTQGVYVMRTDGIDVAAVAVVDTGREYGEEAPDAPGEAPPAEPKQPARRTRAEPSAARRKGKPAAAAKAAKKRTAMSQSRTRAAATAKARAKPKRGAATKARTAARPKAQAAGRQRAKSVKRAAAGRRSRSGRR